MKKESHTFQILLWALLGPWMCLFTLFVLWVKGGSVPNFFPLSLLIGMPICWKWKWVGAAISSFVLFGYMFFSYSLIPLEDHFWFVGMGISIALSLLITALSFEEVEVLVDAQAVESRSRLDNLWKVDEKKKVIEEELTKKKEVVRELQMKIRSYQKLVDMATEETLATRTRLQESEQERQQIKEQMAALEEEVRRHLTQHKKDKREEIHRKEVEILHEMVSSFLEKGKIGEKRKNKEEGL